MRAAGAGVADAITRDLQKPAAPDHAKSLTERKKVVEVKKERSRRGLKITERDEKALAWIGDQWAVRMDVLSVVLGRLGETGGPLSVWGVRNQVNRWKRMGLVETGCYAPGGTWVTLTRRGYDMAGQSWDRWRMPAAKLRHVHAVNTVRLAYEARPRTVQWTSERELWRLSAGVGWRVPDGALIYGGGMTAVEVELSLKARARYRHEVFGERRSGACPVREMRWFVPDEDVAVRLKENLRWADDSAGQVAWTVEMIPDVAGVTAW